MAQLGHHSRKRYVVSGIIITVAAIFVVKLFYMQVISDKYKVLSESNVRRIVTIYPARGIIYDRKGRKIVSNEEAYDLMVVPRQVNNIDTNELCQLLEIDKQSFISRLNKARQYSPYRASPFVEQISKTTYGYLQEKLYRFPGFFVQPRTLRTYLYPIAAHTLGYVGEVNQKEIEDDPYYKMGDYIGKSGIEKYYEKELRGVKGEKIVLVDVFNREKGSFENGLYDKPQQSGQDLTTTLDLDLQLLGEKLMQNKRGSIVAIEPSTGEILAIISSPSYDPNLLVGRVRGENFKRLSQDVMNPLFNRSIQATYSPGSTFKVVNGLVGLETGAITPETRFSCNGKASVPIACTHSHYSPLELIGAIEQSCNPYFWGVFRTTIEKSGKGDIHKGYNIWRQNVMSLGFGNYFNTDIPNQVRGNIPSPQYYDHYFGKNGWRALTIRSLAIGQGEILVTPLQLANQAATIANKGYYYPPHVVKSIQGRPTQWERNQSSIHPQHFETIIKGMYRVFQGESGTGRWYKLDSIAICGKTGTVQNPHGKDHSLCIAFAPANNPKIAIAVVVENAGFGATWAVPIASLMIEKYLTGKISRTELETRMSQANLL
ncbi:MAG: Penicillin-binding protein 2 [Bacteroidetes bacterium 38_7]|nr:MAG: Penicillin-binding protein 2 [Bacteroidetes bacterium 38_7]HAL65975.1 penicillin-binding protein 2 [Bacteroidales bacterium]